MTQNLLATQASPYLQQHKDNPVHWMPWGNEALDLAKRTNKPILLSIGYAACHWCHVMAHESFEDLETANVMNELFVNIKVDREERPDIDDIYMGALHMMGVQGGWPLTMFLTPHGEPFWGGTYFPKTSRSGMPAFTDVCQEISRLFKEEHEKVRANADQLTLAVQQRSKMNARAHAIPDFVHQAAIGLYNHMDTAHGGMQGRPKFPQPFVFSFIWESGYLSNQKDMCQRAHQTAAQISNGGIYDHLGGGFARYSVDEKWCVPHFEKMLYDNALLLDLFATLYKEQDNPVYRNRAEETVAWLENEMRLSEGGFAASLDADTEGEEGRYYVWRETEIRELLGDQADGFMSYYDVSPQGNFEGANILNTLGTQDNFLDEKFASARKALLKHRQSRTPPGRDHKVLADWNGLMIGALARSAHIFHHPHWIDLAKQAYAFIKENMSHERAGCHRLVHVWCEGFLGENDTAEDYANMMDAALALYSATGDQSYLEDAEAFMGTLDAVFACTDAGGYFMTAIDAEAILARPRHARDNALPNANGSIIWSLSRLAALIGHQHYARQADALAESFWLHTEKEFPQMTSSLSGFLRHQNAISCVVTGQPEDETMLALLSAVRQHPHPGLIIQPVYETNTITSAHPAYEYLTAKQTPVAQAYLCLKDKCLPPIDSPDVLIEKLDHL